MPAEPEPCHKARVRIWEDANGKIIRTRLLCPGHKCDSDREQCKKRRSENHHGGVREWCGCDDIEDMKVCHVVVYTRGLGEGGQAGDKEVFCAGTCSDDPEAVCTPVIVAERKLYPSGRVIDVACECL